MKRLLSPILAFLLTQTPSIAQLVLIVDQTTQQIDWLDGSIITRLPSQLDNTRFGIVTFQHGAQISSPLLSYSGAGSHSGMFFEFSPDNTTITGISLDTTLPPGDGASFSGTPAGPAIPAFASNDVPLLTGLSKGDYTLGPLGPWSDGIRVVVVPEPTPFLLGCVGLGLVVILRWGWARLRLGDPG